MAAKRSQKRTINPDSPRKRIKDQRKNQLIEAAIVIIAKLGLTQTTIATVSGEAGMSRGIINFYFKSKETMLKEVLANLLATEHEAIKATLQKYSDAPAAERLMALVDTLSSPKLYTKKRLAAWCAFAAFAASNAPTRYAFERAYNDTNAVLTELCRSANAPSPVISASLLMTYIQGARFNEVTGIATVSKEELFAQLRLFEHVAIIAPEKKEDNVFAIHQAKTSKPKKKAALVDDDKVVVADLFANL